MHISFVLLLQFTTFGSEVLMSEASSPISEGWTTAREMYEGFPLYLRAPTKIDYSQAASFPTLVMITHVLEDVRSSGLPEPQYNTDLFDFDEEVVALFERSGDGYTVLIETFGGKRTYYQYVSSDAAIQKQFDDLTNRYPEHKLMLEHRLDPDWSFRKKYADDFEI